MHRRTLMLMAATFPLASPLGASTRLGEVRDVTGPGRLVRDGAEEPLVPGLPLLQGDRAETGETGLALLWLDERTRIHLGHSSTVELAAFLTEVGGTLSMGGAIVFDRPDDLPPLDLTIATAFGEIGVRGTRFFAGPSRGEFAVFVERGAVEVRGAGVSRRLGPGEGCGMVEGAAPGEVVAWGAARIDEAFASVGLTRG